MLKNKEYFINKIIFLLRCETFHLPLYEYKEIIYTKVYMGNLLTIQFSCMRFSYSLSTEHCAKMANEGVNLPPLYYYTADW